MVAFGKAVEDCGKKWADDILKLDYKPSYDRELLESLETLEDHNVL